MIFEKITCLQCQKFTLEALCCRFFLEIIFPNHFGKFYKKRFCGGVPSTFWGLSKIQKISEIWQALKIRSQTRFWGRGFGGSNVADFCACTTCRSILLDLLLVGISGIWGPSKRSTKKLRKWEILTKKSEKLIFFRFRRNFWMSKKRQKFWIWPQNRRFGGYDPQNFFGELKVKIFTPKKFKVKNRKKHRVEISEIGAKV